MPKDTKTPQFTDTEGRVWPVRIDVGRLKSIRDNLGINLYADNGVPAIEQMASDPIMVCDVLWKVCKKKADEEGIEYEDFLEAVVGDTLGEATDALMEAVQLFSPSPEVRANLKKIADGQKTLARMIQKKAGAKLNFTEEQLEKIAEETIEKHLRTSGGSSTSTPESPASTPPPTPSESSSG
jgi:hypothetical protein